MNPMEKDGPVKPRGKFPWIIYLVVLFLILAVTLAPVGSLVLSGWIANANGCALDEGSAHPCVIGGVDRGELLYTMFVLGWLMFLTFPAGALAFTGWLIVFLLHRLAWRKRPR